MGCPAFILACMSCHVMFNTFIYGRAVGGRKGEREHLNIASWSWMAARIEYSSYKRGGTVVLVDGWMDEVDFSFRSCLLFLFSMRLFILGVESQVGLSTPHHTHMYHGHYWMEWLWWAYFFFFLSCTTYSMPSKREGRGSTCAYLHIPTYVCIHIHANMEYRRVPR